MTSEPYVCVQDYVHKYIVWTEIFWVFDLCYQLQGKCRRQKREGRNNVDIKS